MKFEDIKQRFIKLVCKAYERGLYTDNQWHLLCSDIAECESVADLLKLRKKFENFRPTVEELMGKKE